MGSGVFYTVRAEMLDNLGATINQESIGEGLVYEIFRGLLNFSHCELLL
jgi:hypothetical protein